MSKFYPPVLGGIESVAWELVEGLNSNGMRADVLCSNQSWLTVREHFPGDYDVVRAGSVGMFLSTSMSVVMPSLVAEMGRRADILHVHMPDPMAALAVWLARPKCRVVVHWHSDVIRQRRSLVVYEPLQRWLLHRADAVIATSPPYMDASEPLQPWRNKVCVIPIGISDNRPAASADLVQTLRRRYGERRMVFALGRMTYYKGFDILVEAASQLPDDCVVVIGGVGEMLETFKSIARQQGLTAKVQFVGHIPDNELPSYFAACDVFCFSSTVRAEAYGVAMLEAMVMGKPVVATDIAGSGVPWVNQHGVTGLNVCAGESRPLAAALRSLLDDVEMRAALGAGGRKRYEQEFDSKRMTAKTIELYGQLT
ncbi:glycosyltransferase [Roseateles albus]|uniref:Glycosyltransferase n=1 Tax=Roseateles albus TaxID=2987525 RepID=A0ABT5KGQ6_9BURK|nr:glycosyltransferase [Roseateles albus]MDC8772729.1 glycosyltransferase [Roseateles albus]